MKYYSWLNKLNLESLQLWKQPAESADLAFVYKILLGVIRTESDKILL